MTRTATRTASRTAGRTAGRTATTTDRSAARGDSPLRSRRGVLAGLLGTSALVGAWASFMVPLLHAGLADAPMVTVRDPSDATWQFSVPAVATLPDPLPSLVWLLWFAVIALGPLVGAVGAVVGSGLVVREVRDRRPARAVAWALTAAGCAGVLVLALSPWGRTATAWFFD